MGKDEKVKPSFALWIPLIWFFIVSTRNISRWTGSGDMSQLDSELGSPADRLVLTALMVLGIAVLAWRRTNRLEIVKCNKWILALFVYMALSVAWSNFPDISFRRWIRSAGNLIMALVALTEIDPVESISALFKRCYYIHLPLSILSIKYYRSIGVDYSKDGSAEEWTGLTIHKNNLGQVAMTSSVFFSWKIMKAWGRNPILIDFLFLMMSLFLLRGSGTAHSTTSIVGFGIGLCLLLLLGYLRKRIRYAMRSAIAWLIVVVLLAGMIQLFLDTFEEKSIASVAFSASGRDATLTGRTGLWNDILINASNSPILGVGYAAFWVGPIGYEMYPLENWSKVTPGWRPNQGHNGYLDVYVELGLIGLFLVLGVIMSAFRNISKTIQTNFEYGRVRLVYLIIILVNNVTESSLLKGTHSLWFLFLLFAVNIPVGSASPPVVENVMAVGRLVNTKG